MQARRGNEIPGQQKPGHGVGGVLNPTVGVSTDKPEREESTRATAPAHLKTPYLCTLQEEAGALGALQPLKHLPEALAQLRAEDVAPPGLVASAAGPASVDHALGQVGQDLVALVWKGGREACQRCTGPSSALWVARRCEGRGADTKRHSLARNRGGEEAQGPSQQALLTLHPQPASSLLLALQPQDPPERPSHLAWTQWSHLAHCIILLS